MIRFLSAIPSFLILTVVVLLFGAVVWLNAQSAPSILTIIPTEVVPTDDPLAWQRVLQENFGNNSTPLPTIAIPRETFAPPTLILSDSNQIPIGPAQVSGDQRATENPAATPTLASAIASVSTLAVTEQFVTRPPSDWQPPALIPPISRDPLGRDHYWLVRPVDSNARNFEIYDYPYGSDGPPQQTPWRIHHGIDMPNPIGEAVRAAGSGVVLWAGPDFQNTFSYGNVVFIRHDFGYRGQPIYTLYAHLSAVLTTQGAVVDAGEPIGLIGNTGRVSGPHVHFEVRMGGDRYGDTYNPVLWMVPYVGHGTIAGLVTNARGTPLQDQTITVRDRRNGLVVRSTTSYLYLDNDSDVNADPLWQENFAMGDIPAGRYEVITTIDGLRVSRFVDVVEGVTNFVELTPLEAATAQPEATVTP
jgi:murein DD-endopeptidase MepM/ murein hydrolase activator NlpD